MVAEVKKLYVCHSCGLAVSSVEKPSRCPRCSSKFKIEKAEEFEYFWPKAPSQLKESYIRSQVEKALEQDLVDMKENGASKPKSKIEAEISKKENDKFLKFLLDTKAEDIKNILDSLGYLYLLAMHSSSPELIHLLLSFHKDLEAPVKTLSSLKDTGAIGLVDLKKLYSEK